MINSLHSRLLRTLVVVLLLAIPQAGCAVVLTEAGSNVRIVSEQERGTCKFLTTISSQFGDGLDESQDVEGAMNQARNKVGAAGGNAMKIIATDTNQARTVVTVEALLCPSP